MDFVLKLVALSLQDLSFAEHLTVRCQGWSCPWAPAARESTGRRCPVECPLWEAYHRPPGL